MIEVSDIRVTLDDGRDTEALLAAGRRRALRVLGLRPADVTDATLARVSVDARKKHDVHFVVSVRMGLCAGLSEADVVAGVSPSDTRCIHLAKVLLTTWNELLFPEGARQAVAPAVRPVVVGAGCAGLFCALVLAEAGLCPLLIERGDNATRRTESVLRFNTTGVLDPESNIQFGLGGAGTFSDGKLTTGTKNPAHRLILQTFVEAGAPPEILWEAKPHIGSDILPGVVSQMVKRICELGGEVRFRTRLMDIQRKPDGEVCGVTVEDARGETEAISTDRLVLACGHSARDVFELLLARGFALARKTFAMGVRVEHAQADVNCAQYGLAAGHPALGTASYKLVAHCENGRSLFSFCMCPGGSVVAAASEPGGVVTNGASLHARAGQNANAALLVNITPEDLPGNDVLAGVNLQRHCEQLAYKLGGGAYQTPAQLVGDFLSKRPSVGAGHVVPTYSRGVTWSSIDKALPPHVIETLRQGLPLLACKLSAFKDDEAVLTAVESRSSSPVTVLRNRTTFEAVGAPGLYPCGEGAGYAGGIMSAATDGIRIAQAIVRG